MMRHWLAQPFTLLDTQRSRLKLVVFCGIFGFLFLWIFVPFQLNTWFVSVAAPLPAILVFFIAAAMAALALSQFALRALLKISRITLGGFLLWYLLEYLLISLAAHLINAALLDTSVWDMQEGLATLRYTFLILMVPYVLGLILLYLEKQWLTIRELRATKHPTDPLISIPDEYGRLAIQVYASSILFIKSEDNYAELVCRVSTGITRHLIRTSLKRLEQRLPKGILLRVHRSYLVNKGNIHSVIRQSGNYVIQMEGVDQLIPVSATYASQLIPKAPDFTPES